MPLPNIFTKEVTDQLIQRINKLTPETDAQWGKMDVAQMLAHCNVTYELVYDNIHPKPGFFVQLLLKAVAKGAVVSEKSYRRNGPTGPQFVIKSDKNFTEEKTRLINHLTKTQQLGEKYFDQKESHSFGKLSITEWNNMFYKHLDHHLIQFGV